MSMRPGATALSVLSVPLNVHILSALDEEGRPLNDLSRIVGHPPASTMRTYLRTLSDLGVVERRREPDFPGSVNYAITGPGEKLLRVAQALQAWLRAAPEGPVALASPAAKSAIKALLDAWSIGLVRAIATRPFALTELSRLIPQVSYPTLERRLTAMRRVGLVEPESSGSRRGTPYCATLWLRHAICPLTAAISWERCCAPTASSSLSRIDVEAIFLLAVPLLSLPFDASGVCRLSVELRSRPEPQFAGVMVTLEEGEVASCVARLAGEADAWAAGTPRDWFGWVNGYDGKEIDLGGDTSLAYALANGFREALAPRERV
jgi:DNA-binding HxlR family transcriptional regulator